MKRARCPGLCLLLGLVALLVLGADAGSGVSKKKIGVNQEADAVAQRGTTTFRGAKENPQDNSAVVTCQAKASEGESVYGDYATACGFTKGCKLVNGACVSADAEAVDQCDSKASEGESAYGDYATACGFAKGCKLVNGACVSADAEDVTPSSPAVDQCQAKALEGESVYGDYATACGFAKDCKLVNGACVSADAEAVDQCDSKASEGESVYGDYATACGFAKDCTMSGHKCVSASGAAAEKKHVSKSDGARPILDATDSLPAPVDSSDDPAFIGACRSPNQVINPDLGGCVDTPADLCKTTPSRVLKWKSNVCFLDSVIFPMFGVNDFFLPSLNRAHDGEHTQCSRWIRKYLRKTFLEFRSNKNGADYDSNIGRMRHNLTKRLMGNCLAEAVGGKRRNLVEITGTGTLTMLPVYELVAGSLRVNNLGPAATDAMWTDIKAAKGWAADCAPLPASADRAEPLIVRIRPQGNGLDVNKVYDSTSDATVVAAKPDGGCPDYRISGTFAVRQQDASKITITTSSILKGPESCATTQACATAGLATILSHGETLYNLPEWFVLLATNPELRKYVSLTATLNGADAPTTKYYELIGEGIGHGGHFVAMGKCQSRDVFMYHDDIAQTYKVCKQTKHAVTDNDLRSTGLVTDSMLYFREITQAAYETGIAP